MKPTSEVVDSVVVILYPGCIFFEIALATEILKDKFRIVYVTPDGSDHLASNGSVLKAQASYAGVDLKNARALLIPGGDPGSVVEDKNLDRLVQQAQMQNLWLAAICAGPLVLAKAGVLRGKKIAHGYGPKELDFLKSYFTDVNLSDAAFECDESILTAKPEAHIEFAVELACRLGVIDAGRSGKVKDYYRGVLGRKIRALALALIRNSRGEYLYHQGHDRVKGENFYRPLGGGIEFHESGETAVVRELDEELGARSSVTGLVASMENIFEYEGHRGHEIVLLFETELKDTELYDRKEIPIGESGQVIGKAVWRSIAAIHDEGAQLYPAGLESVLRKLENERARQ